MLVFTMSKGITKAISSINRCFFWKSSLNSHGICKVAWHKVIKSKLLGGLGLGSIHNKNLALMFKWLWNLDKGVVGDWQELILRKYRPHFTNGLPVFASSLSPTWRGMVSSISLNHNIAAPIQSNVGFKVGDGRNIRFWSDSWLGYVAHLQFMFPRLYDLSLQQSLRVAEVHNPTDNSINLSWRRPLQPRELCMCESLIAEVERGLVFSDGEDNKI